MFKIQIIIVAIFIAIIFILIWLNNKKLTYVKSDIDNEDYLVRDLSDKQSAANMLARIKKNIMILTDYLIENKDTTFIEFKPYIEQLSRNIKRVKITENDAGNSYTSYSVNKGEQIVFCLRSRKQRDKIHDINLIMYVALHEISHVACPTYGHDELFKKIFAFFTRVAISINLYKYTPFNEQPTEYCGLIISESII